MIRLISKQPCCQQINKEELRSYNIEAVENVEH